MPLRQVVPQQCLSTTTASGIPCQTTDAVLDLVMFFSDEPFCKHPGAVPVQQTTGVNQTNDQTPNHPEHGGKLTPCGR